MLDRRRGKVSGKGVPSAREAEVEALYKTRYAGFTAKHFHEHLARDRGFKWGYILGSSPRAGSGPSCIREASSAPSDVGRIGARGRAGCGPA